MSSSLSDDIVTAMIEGASLCDGKHASAKKHDYFIYRISHTKLRNMSVRKGYVIFAFGSDEKKPWH
jgi:hypothetical protein